MSKLQLDNVSYVYSPDTPFEKEALTDVCIDFKENRITGIIGHTGSGKSTVAQLLNGLLRPTSGRVLLDGKDIFDKGSDIMQVRFRVGLVFQYPEYQLFEETVWRDIAFGPSNMKLPAEEIDRRVRTAAEFTGIDKELFERSPFELSGGQKRRVAIAGIMAMEPEIIVLDEPAAGLDPQGRDEIFNGIKKWRESHNATVILISHSMEDMAMYADDIVVMNHGHVLTHGTVDEVFLKADTIRESGLDIPQITSLTEELTRLGIIDGSGIYTVDMAYKKIFEALKEG
ncbi:MAG: energy-coupling factor transporter ATPase [Ruminococcaceae bacterium]|nr:energy-coupling factor transporter ATPase [Oscillospiraceae bacterium]